MATMIWTDEVPKAVRWVPFRAVVTTAGTPVPLAATSTPCKYVMFMAETNNTGIIAGPGNADTKPDATLATRTGFTFNPGEGFGGPALNLADIYIDSTVNGDGVTGAYAI